MSVGWQSLGVRRPLRDQTSGNIELSGGHSDAIESNMTNYQGLIGWCLRSLAGRNRQLLHHSTRIILHEHFGNEALLVGLNSRHEDSGINGPLPGLVRTVRLSLAQYGVAIREGEDVPTHDHAELQR